MGQLDHPEGGQVQLNLCEEMAAFKSIKGFEAAVAKILQICRREVAIAELRHKAVGKSFGEDHEVSNIAKGWVEGIKELLSLLESCFLQGAEEKEKWMLIRQSLVAEISELEPDPAISFELKEFFITTIIRLLATRRIEFVGMAGRLQEQKKKEATLVYNGIVKGQTNFAGILTGKHVEKTGCVLQRARALDKEGAKEKLGGIVYDMKPYMVRVVYEEVKDDNTAEEHLRRLRGEVDNDGEEIDLQDRRPNDKEVVKVIAIVRGDLVAFYRIVLNEIAARDGKRVVRMMPVNTPIDRLEID